MWCSHCQQDVPGVVSARDRNILCCPRCSEELNGEPAPSSDPEPQDQAEDDWNDWELSDSLEEATTAIESLRAGEFRYREQEGEEEPFSLRPRSRPAAAVATPPGRSGLAFVLVMLGITALACGLVLIGWSLLASRPELWQWGLPAALAGQGALLIGFVLQLDALGQASRAQSQQLTQTSALLADLTQSVQVLNATQSGPSQNFYAHYAAGARPELLMADLKSQLDLLASRMGE